MKKFIKAQFENSSKLYDYLCEIEDIKKGDKVYVDTHEGEKIVTVRGIFYSKLEDMPLQGYRYKCVTEKYVLPKVTRPEPDWSELFPKQDDSLFGSGFEVINSTIGIGRSKYNRNLLVYKNKGDSKIHTFLLLRWRRGTLITQEWFITDKTNIRKGDFVYINEHVKNCYPTYGRVEKVVECTYAKLNSPKAFFWYVNQKISSAEVFKAKKYLGIWTADDYWNCAKECVFALIVIAFLYWVMFTEEGRETWRLYRDFERDFPRKP